MLRKRIIPLIIILLSHSGYAQYSESFIENRGQWSEEVEYLLPLKKNNLYFTGNKILFQKLDLPSRNQPGSTAAVHQVFLNFHDSKRDILNDRENSSGTEYQFLRNNNGNTQNISAKSYKKIIFDEVYVDIDINYELLSDSSVGINIESDKALSINNLKINSEGQKKLLIQDNGDLLIFYNSGSYNLTSPVAKQYY